MRARANLSGVTTGFRSAKNALAGAIRYARGCWPALVRYVDDGRLEMTNNAAQPAIRPLALGRKKWAFAGSDEGGHRAAAIYTLIETAKMNGLDPEAYLRSVTMDETCAARYPRARGLLLGASVPAYGEAFRL